MGIIRKRDGNQCEKCKGDVSKVGKITHYTKHGADLLLCPKCLEFREKSYTVICPKCKRIAYEHGGLTYYDDSDLDDSNDSIVTENYEGFDSFDYDEKPPSSSELMCLECHEKKVAREKKIRKIKLTIKNFAKDHWFKWIMIGLGIIAILVAVYWNK